MSIAHSLLKAFSTIGLILTLGMSMNAEAGLFGFGGDSWKEEVLLHDGSKIIVERSQSYGGRHEIGQPSPIKEHILIFTLPSSHKSINWKDEYSEDIGHSNFNLLALHILNETPYIVASPDGSIAYNKWGRPNPPYVFFKYDGREWQRIALEEFPIEFKNINLVVSTLSDIKKLFSQGLTTAEMVRELNSSLTQEEYKTIARTPLEHWKPRPPRSNSGRMVRAEGGWIGMDWFEDQPTNEACLMLCKMKKVSSQDCPCNTLFERK